MGIAEKISSRCPVILTEKVSAIMDVVSPPHFISQTPALPSVHEVDVIWLIDTYSTVRFIHGGQVLKEGSTYNDFYGLGTSAESALEAMQQNMASFAVSAESSLIMDVVTSIYAVPVYQTSDDISDSQDYAKRGSSLKSYSRYPSTLRIKGHQYNQEAQYLERHLLKEVVLTSSKDTISAQQDALKAFIGELYEQYSIQSVRPD